MFLVNISICVEHRFLVACWHSAGDGPRKPADHFHLPFRSFIRLRQRIHLRLIRPPGGRGRGRVRAAVGPRVEHHPALLINVKAETKMYRSSRAGDFFRYIFVVVLKELRS